MLLSAVIKLVFGTQVCLTSSVGIGELCVLASVDWDLRGGHIVCKESYEVDRFISYCSQYIWSTWAHLPCWKSTKNNMGRTVQVLQMQLVFKSGWRQNSSPNSHPDFTRLFYHDVDEIFWPQPIRSLKFGHVTGQGSMSPTWVGRGPDPGKMSFIKSIKTWIILLYIWLHL